MLKLRYIAIALFLLFGFALPLLAAPQYIASRMRQPFHHISCRWAQQIVSSNAIYYETRDEAIDDGHRPCKTCHP